MIYELFAVGTIWFWLVLAAWVGWLVYCVILDNAFYRSILSIPVFLAFLQLFTYCEPEAPTS
jgi:hypothetical protein